MGCVCINNNNEEINTDIKVNKNKIIYGKDFDNDKINAITKIQSNYRKFKAHQNLKKGVDYYKNKFINDLKTNDNIEILSESDINTYISKKINNSYNNFFYDNDIKIILKENEMNFDFISNVNDNVNNKDLSSFKIPPLKNKKKNEIYYGNYKYNNNENNFELDGEGKIITKEKELIVLNSYNDNKNNTLKNKIILSKDNKKNEILKNVKMFYNNGDIFLGDLEDNFPYKKINGIILYKNDDNNNLNVNKSYHNYIKSQNFNSDHIIAKSMNKEDEIYEGEVKLKDKNIYIPNGKGKIYSKKDNIIYQGNFKEGKYNGKGCLYTPLKDDKNFLNNDEKTIIEKNIENNNNLPGKYINCTWINGYENGNGIITEIDKDNNIKTFSCIFRFGKIIKLTKKYNKKFKLHKNIFEFLDIKSNYVLFSNFQTKGMLEYIKENNYENMNKLKMYKLINNNNDIKYNFLNYKIENLNDIIENYKNNNFFLIPITAFRTNGGCIEDRYRYQNIFNPEIYKVYTTHYTYLLNKDIEIDGVFNFNLFQNNEKFDNNNINNENEINNKIINIQKKYIDIYNNFDNNYPNVDKYHKIIDDSDLILKDELIGDISKKLFCINYISIHIPRKFDYLSMINEPCKFLSIYIYNDIKLKNKEIEIASDDIIKYNENIIDIYNNLKDKYNIIKFEENKNFNLIEFDSSNQNINNIRLMCLIEIKELNLEEEPFIIELNKFVHIGRYLSVYLINQRLLYDQKIKTAIDFGTINFYGEILFLK